MDDITKRKRSVNPNVKVSQEVKDQSYRNVEQRVKNAIAEFQELMKQKESKRENVDTETMKDFLDGQTAILNYVISKLDFIIDSETDIRNGW